MKATNTALLPIDSLKPAAWEAVIIPELGTKVLMSVKKLADNGYTTIFHPDQNGVTVHSPQRQRLCTQREQASSFARMASGKMKQDCGWCHLWMSTT